MRARSLSSLHPGASWGGHEKPTGLFTTDPTLRDHQVTVDYWKTGHSYIKRRVNELGALAGFEKSGHFFFNAPIGRGYDDGLVAAVAICEMLDRNHGTSLSALRATLTRTLQSPTMSPHCPDEVKYEVVARAVEHFEERAAKGDWVAGQPVRDLVTVNGVRITLEDGTWGLVRASSNKPELVVVVESPTSEEKIRAIFAEIDAFLATQPEVGSYNQKI
jgi:phosphomannomutase / phosphoglucomutase